MTYYMQNGADDGTVIGYPDEVGSEVEDFLYEACGYGRAYPCNPVRHISEEQLIEERCSPGNVTEVPMDVIEKIRAVMNEADKTADYDTAGDEINDLICEYVVHPDHFDLFDKEA